MPLVNPSPINTPADVLDVVNNSDISPNQLTVDTHLHINEAWISVPSMGAIVKAIDIFSQYGVFTVDANLGYNSRFIISGHSSGNGTITFTNFSAPLSISIDSAHSFIIVCSVNSNKVLNATKHSWGGALDFLKLINLGINPVTISNNDDVVYLDTSTAGKERLRIKFSNGTKKTIKNDS